MSTFGPIFVGGCCHCGSSSSGCPCATTDDLRFCNAGTLPESFTCADSGIALCPCASNVVEAFSVDSFPLNLSRCLTSIGQVVAAETGVAWDSPSSTAPVHRWNNPDCTGLLETQDVTFSWQLYRFADRWRLVLSGFFHSGDGGVTLVLFDSSVYSTGPLDCCQSLHFDNHVSGCGLNGPPVFGDGGGVYLATGGSVDLTPCCGSSSS